MHVPDPGASYRIAVGTLRPLLQTLTRREWSGAEHIPRKGGVIVAVNHVSHVDPLVLGHFIHDQGRSVRFLAKQALFDVRLFGRFLSNAGQIPVRRQSREAGDALRSAEEAIERGECLVFYPEGTITRDPDLWPMVGKTGVARVALATGCDVIPVAQWGAQEILAPYAKVPRLIPRKIMQVAAGPPVDLSAFRGQVVTSPLLKKASGTVMDAVTGLLEGIRNAKAPVERFDPASQGLPAMGNFRQALKRANKKTRADGDSNHGTQE